jgi:hypothetical protein
MNLIIFLLLCLLGAAYTSAEPSQVLVYPAGATDIKDLALRLLQSPVHDPDIYTRAVAVLDSLQSAPSCHRIATVSLIDSCQSLDSNVADASLSEVREKYATRLAMCELSGAKVQLPSQCDPFVISTRHCPKKPSTGILGKLKLVGNDLESEPCFASTDTAQLKRCLNVIHEKPQWWTSYSNALQNVFLVCQASRGAVEQGKLSRFVPLDYH